MKSDIEKARPTADLVVVSFHWGAELMTAAKDYQIELGRKAIDWGADLVLGHHPHVLQELEVYQGRLIAYSLGNFVFGSESNRTNTSMILLLTFQGKSLARVEAVPLDVNNYRVKYRPRVLTGQAAREVLESVNAGSERFKTKLDIANDRGTLLLAPSVKAPTRGHREAMDETACPETSTWTRKKRITWLKRIRSNETSFPGGLLSDLSVLTFLRFDRVK